LLLDDGVVEDGPETENSVHDTERSQHHWTGAWYTAKPAGKMPSERYPHICEVRD
jgi:hypothetical protein